MLFVSKKYFIFVKSINKASFRPLFKKLDYER